MSRASIKAKIAALRAKTTSAGCTEAEALAAAALAADLMVKHGLSEAEIEMVEAAAREKTVTATWRTDLASMIAHCTNTASVVSRDGDGAIVTFIGREPGPEIAVYLRDVLFRAVDRELRAFKTSTYYKRRRTLKAKRAAAADFVAGVVRRLRWRLLEMFKPSLDPEAKAEAKKALDLRWPETVDYKAPARQERYFEAAHLGWKAGANATLGHGVTGDRPTLQIGGTK